MTDDFENDPFALDWDGKQNNALDSAISEGMKSSGFTDEHFDRISGPHDEFKSQFFSDGAQPVDRHDPPRSVRSGAESSGHDHFAENRKLWKEHGLSEADAMRNLALLERAYHHDREGTVAYLSGKGPPPAIVQQLQFLDVANRMQKVSELYKARHEMRDDWDTFEPVVVEQIHNLKATNPHLANNPKQLLRLADARARAVHKLLYPQAKRRQEPSPAEQSRRAADCAVAAAVKAWNGKI